MATFTERVDQYLREIFIELKNRGGRARGREVLDAIAPRLKLTPHELETTKAGAVRWETFARFHSVGCVKAGFLQKTDGVWTLTPAGEKALSCRPGELVREAGRAYRSWDRTRPDAPEISATPELPAEPESAEQEAGRVAAHEQANESARAEIDAHLARLGPFEFQRLVGELLRAMGYHVRREAPPGPDGGVDILAYRDPLGTQAPRIHVQVKHRESKVTVKEVRELEGLVRRDGDIGLIVSSAGFSTDAEREIRSSTKHIDTMDQDRLVQLWREHYQHISEPGKSLLPLVAVHFLAPAEPS